MADFADARCTEHPGRAAAATCTRCGNFICDWCVKLAPSWGPGLCAQCQKVKHTAALPPMALSKGFIVVSVLIFIRPWWTLWGLRDVFALGAQAVDGQDAAAATAAMGLLATGVLFVGLSFVAMALFWLRRKAARPVLLAAYGLDSLDLIALVAMTDALSGAVVVRLAINAAIMVWVVTAPEAKRMLAR
jgi:hypothetical protein